MRPEWQIGLLIPSAHFVEPLLRFGTVQACTTHRGRSAREGVAHVMKRKGAKMRSLTLLYHGRLFHCSMVNSNLSARVEGDFFTLQQTHFFTCAWYSRDE
jgi:hypothetical protein